MEEYIELRKSISTYIHKYPTPTREQNDTLLRELKSLAESTEAIHQKRFAKIREKLVLSNGGFAMKYVMKYRAVLNDEVSIMDLFQEANLGLIEAIDTFDTAFKTSFTTHAFFHVRKRIIDFIKKNKLVRAPRDIARNMKHVNEIKNELFTEKQREPTTIEIAETLEKRRNICLPEAMIDSIIILLDLNSSGYEESFISEFNEQVFTNESEESLFKRMEMSLNKELEQHNKRFKEIVRLRFGIGCDYPHTLEEIKYMLKVDNEELKRLGPK